MHLIFPPLPDIPDIFFRHPGASLHLPGKVNFSLMTNLSDAISAVGILPFRKNPAP